ncbi:MAG: copper resistance protein NlpE N-terminal domain-containing protein, partial [Methylomonas sp.]|nr:copper resistance protein NlpE N-terminal domain-containing protein [Methylomonas sp.]
EREFTEKGKFEWSETGNVITLTPRSSDGSRMYEVEADRLIQLDARGNRITGKLADRYILKRKDMSDTGPSNPGHGGH